MGKNKACWKYEIWNAIVLTLKNVPDKQNQELQEMSSAELHSYVLPLINFKCPGPVVHKFKY